MAPLTILDNIRIASPCDADWSKMAGDDRSRFCGSCSKQVYNIAAMTAEEATALILEREGRLCVQVYRRRDGTVLTADCPVGGQVLKGRRFRRILAAGLILPAMLATGIGVKAGFGKRQIGPFPTGPGITWDDRLEWALVTLGLRKPLRMDKGMMMGDFDYVPGSPSSPIQAQLQRERMKAAGIPVPEEPCPAPPD